MSDTYSSFSLRGKRLSPHPEVTFICLFREVGALGERLKLEIIREDRFGFFHIERHPGVENSLDCLQLGSCSTEVDHSGCVGFMLVGGGECGRVRERGRWFVTYNSEHAPEVRLAAFHCIKRPAKLRLDCNHCKNCWNPARLDETLG